MSILPLWLQFAKAQQDTLARGLKETGQSQAVGFLAMTDVQEAQAGYDRLAGLRDEIPLIPPDPADAERWVSQALTQNFGLLVSEQAVQIAKADIAIPKAVRPAWI